MRVNNYFNIQSFANIKRRNLLRHNVYLLPCNERAAQMEINAALIFMRVECIFS